MGADLKLGGARIALSFLTRVPAGVHALEDAELARSVPWFPLVGAMVGAVVAGVYALSLEAMPGALAASLAITAGVLLTGAFHEDGLADSIDAIGSGAEPARAREILKDPTHGTFGVVALVMSLLIRVIALSTLDAWAALAVLISAHACARAAALPLMSAAPPGDRGLGAAYGRAVSRGDVFTGLALTSVILAGSIGILTVGGFVIAAVMGLAMARLATSKLGAVTGDVLGAIEQLVEIGVLVLCAAAFTNGWVALPWWR